jgi:hypothetical protein
VAVVRAPAACRRSWCQPLRVEGVAWSAQRIPTAVNLGFVDRDVDDMETRKLPVPSGNRIRDVQFLARRYTEFAIPALMDLQYITSIQVEDF